MVTNEACETSRWTMILSFWKSQSFNLLLENFVTLNYYTAKQQCHAIKQLFKEQTTQLNILTDYLNSFENLGVKKFWMKQQIINLRLRIPACAWAFSSKAYFGRILFCIGIWLWLWGCRTEIEKTGDVPWKRTLMCIKLTLWSACTAAKTDQSAFLTF